MLAAATGTTFVVADARADVAGGGPNSSRADVALKYELNKGLDTSIDTGYRGFSSGGVQAQVRAVVKIDPVAAGGPLYAIEMQRGAIVEASWGTDKRIVLKPQNGQGTDGVAKVRHTITPLLAARLSSFGITAEFNYDATTILNKLQETVGAGAKFQYDSGMRTQQFAPWGFTAVDTKVPAPDIASNAGLLFTMGFDKLPTVVSDNFDGTLGVRAVTDPTFSYKTQKISLANTAGAISGMAGEVSMPAVDGDYLETMAAVEGELTVKGEMRIQPFIALTRIPQLGAVTINIPITVYSHSYDTTPPPGQPAQKVQFQAVNVHIPLPNVKGPSKGVDLGDVKAGGFATKKIRIENTGEMQAVMSFASSDAAFVVSSDKVTVPPKSSFELDVRFNAASDGPAQSTITINSNDPDSPEQTFRIGANGADVGQEEETGIGGKGGGDADSGCGCKTAGTSSSSVPGWAGLGLLGLGAIVAVRRRKSA